MRHAQRNEIIGAFLNEQMSLEEIDKRFHLVDHSVKGQVKMWSLKLGLFEKVKVIYNWYKSL